MLEYGTTEYERIRDLLLDFESKYNVVILETPKGEQTTYYGGIYVDEYEDYITLFIDGLRRRIFNGIKITWDTVKDIIDNVIIWESGQTLTGYKEMTYKLPENINNIDDIPRNITRTLGNGGILIDLHKIEMTEESKEAPEWCFAEMSRTECFINDMNIASNNEHALWATVENRLHFEDVANHPISVILKENPYTGLCVGLWDNKENDYFIEPVNILAWRYTRAYTMPPANYSSTAMEMRDRVFIDTMMHFFKRRKDIETLTKMYLHDIAAIRAMYEGETA